MTPTWAVPGLFTFSVLLPGHVCRNIRPWLDPRECQLLTVPGPRRIPQTRREVLEPFGSPSAQTRGDPGGDSIRHHILQWHRLPRDCRAGK